MTKEEFEILQSDLQQSGKSVKAYLHEAGVSYSTYNYWRKKAATADEAREKPAMAPISFKRPPAPPVFAEVVPSGATVLFPNGLRVHFGGGTESVLLDLLDKSLSARVLPE